MRTYLVGMQYNRITGVSMDKFALIVGHSRVPDLDSAVFAARVQKLSLFLESNGGYV